MTDEQPIQSEIQKGMEYVVKYNLTRRECEILLQLIPESKSVEELCAAIHLQNSAVHTLLAKLKLKGVVTSAVNPGSKSHKYSLV